MLIQVFRKWFSRNRVSKVSRSHREFACLESLESRNLLATFFWTGDNAAKDLDWSDYKNWNFENTGKPQADMQIPGISDKVVFNGKGNINSAVDRLFTGVVHDITIENTYKMTITLDTTLYVVGGVADINGGTITGSHDFCIGTNLALLAQPFRPNTKDLGAVLNWTGGTLALTEDFTSQGNGPGSVIVGPKSSGKISQGNVKKILDCTFINYSSDLRWQVDTGDSIDVTGNAVFNLAVGNTASFTISTVSHPTALVVNACGLCWSWTTFLYMRSRLSHSRWKTGIEAQDEFAGHFWGGKRLCTTVARSSWQPTSYIDP